MAPKVARMQSPCETGEGISTMRRLLNSLHCPRAGLHTKLIPTISSKKCTVSSFRFRTSMALRSSRAALIAPVNSTCGYKAIFSCTDIHKPRLPHSFCFLDHFIIIGVYFRINYHNLVGFRINVKDFGKTYGRRFCYGGKDHRGVF
ncbi:DNA-directed RNA polymerases II, IV and V subunit 3-like [Pyrus ussuriensis x Pyrus communis]|uniref:DNA-directed RNA polymerases II, IV and V subunit 3-like n=1 Tax=Pyrus ussuriensis x Pyrus communis TaxID=2448454 RepID=A0A5N5H194_9ROSA|nr:DNA-directed RNA polymerases II, IV and V subunit 3-like [Pyrus ussuriensis x Pyrus communis]